MMTDGQAAWTRDVSARRRACDQQLRGSCDQSRCRVRRSCVRRDKRIMRSYPPHALDFASWRLTPWYRQDAIGSIAMSASDDPDYPRPAPDETVKHHIVTKIQKARGHVHTKQVAMLEQASAEYTRIQDNARETRLDACSVLAALYRLGYVINVAADPSTDSYQLHVRGPGIVPGGEEALQRALPAALHHRFLSRRAVIAQVLLAYHGPGMTRTR